MTQTPTDLMAAAAASIPVPQGARFQPVRRRAGISTDQIVRFPSIGGFSPAGPEADSLEAAIAGADFDAVAVIVRYPIPSLSIHSAVAIDRQEA